MGSEQLQEVLNGKIRLSQDGVKIALRYVAGVVGDGDPKLRDGVMAELNVTAGLVVDVEPGSEEHTDDLASFQDGKLRGH